MGLTHTKQILRQCTLVAVAIWCCRSSYAELNATGSDEIYASSDKQIADSIRIANFQHRFSELRKKGAVPSGQPELKSYDYVFIAGLGNELFHKTYFSDMIHTLSVEGGVPANQIHVIFPNSLDSTEINSELLSDKIQGIKSKSSRKIIVIGHSMGGEIALRFFLEHPGALTDSQIKYVVALQSPLKGTVTAKVAADLEQGVYDLGVFFNYLSGKRPCTTTAKLDFHPRKDSGPFSLTPDEARRVLSLNIPKLSSDDITTFKNKLFYVSTSSESENTKLGTYLISGANDGTVPTRSEYMVSLGRRLADLQNIGHTDLVLTGEKSSLAPHIRQAFAQTLFEALLQDSHTLNEEK